MDTFWYVYSSCCLTEFWETVGLVAAHCSEREILILTLEKWNYELILTLNFLICAQVEFLVKTQLMIFLTGYFNCHK